ncbi:LytR family transcriptional regulator [Priestia taiwanensis]|uniref:Polyisoprenyl-teichoic acid--peptidoglycan teichoic acid transferase TagU n=1 Tax=Priestia taiwanensis TaxID=1347902 RepID=A0A917EKM4_9BACI|nr:LytR family transcriptional regulator [Priestia taiwanensis]MBM7361615.1 LCP family protein required for cell wall assembly [Priestia taiwanensis]GGE55525.1 LytR family transcriptional regulator [Priestia taiwanensis]
MSKKKKIIISIVSVFVVLLAAVGVFAYKVYSDVKNTADSIYEPIKTEKVREQEIDVKKKEPFSVLLLGVDSGEFGRTDSGRSDSMTVLTVNPEDQSTKMLSIPRDTRTEIIGKGSQDKINHSYAFGGVEMTVNTVQNFLQIPIDYYVQVDMHSFKEIVDAVGGVDVNNKLDFVQDGTHFAKGVVHLNGDDALKYTRMRKKDPEGDFGRQARQRQVIEAVIKKGASVSTLTSYQGVLSAVENNVKTDLDFGKMISIQADYKSAANKMESVTLQGEGKKIDGIYYLIVSEQSKKQASEELRNHLKLNK